jgi:hypothetical protein
VESSGHDSNQDISGSTDFADISVRPLCHLTDLSDFCQPIFDSTLENPETRIRKPLDCFGYPNTDWKYTLAFSTNARIKTKNHPALSPIPETIQEALALQYATDWQEAMKHEYKYLIDNKSWILQDLPFGRKTIKYKWIYTIKTKPDGFLDRFKARLVAKGCSQQYGMDFHETCSPIIKPPSI